MKIWFIVLTAVFAVQLTPFEYSVKSAWGEEPQQGQAKGDQLMSRIDFGNSYVRGQTIKSGAVYLLNRKKSDIRSMLDSRTDYRQEIREDAEVADATMKDKKVL